MKSIFGMTEGAFEKSNANGRRRSAARTRGLPTCRVCSARGDRTAVDPAARREELCRIHFLAAGESAIRAKLAPILERGGVRT